MKKETNVLTYLIAILVLGAGFPAQAMERDQKKSKSLIAAAKNGDRMEVEKLIQDKTDLNSTDSYDQTALIHAAENGHLEIVELLVQAGAKVNEKDYQGETALHRAVRESNLNMTRYLTEHGADLFAVNEYKGTILRVASARSSLRTTSLSDQQACCDVIVEKMLRRYPINSEAAVAFFCFQSVDNVHGFKNLDIDQFVCERLCVAEHEERVKKEIKTQVCNDEIIDHLLTKYFNESIYEKQN